MAPLVKNIIQERCEKEELDFNRSDRETEDSIAINDKLGSENENEDEEKQFNSNICEREKSIIKELDNEKLLLVTIELFGLLSTKNEDKAGELLWIF